MPRKAYKAMDKNKDGTYSCRGHIFELGKTYTHDGALQPCQSGFHCCPKGVDVYEYYTFCDTTEVFEVEIPDDAEIVEHGDKLCVSKITILQPVPDKGFNTGKDNTGLANTGYRNTGDRNTGYRNTGDRNTGYKNTGYRNTGDRNTGDRNTGNWNKSNNQTGFFNTIEQPVSLFNGRATMTRDEALNHPGMQALNSEYLYTTKWFYKSELEEAQQRRLGEYTDGMTVTVPWEEACADWWSRITPKNKKLIQTIPGFCPDIFKEITGIDVKEAGKEKS